MRKKQYKAFVTGGAGFIGSHLCDELLARGFAVTVLDNLSTGSRRNIAYLLKNNGCFKFVKGNVLDERLVSRLVRNCDIVYHLAAVV